MSLDGPKPAYFWDETTNTWRKAVVGEAGEYVWNTTTNAWEFGTVGAEYVYNHTTKSWEFGPGGQYVRNTSTNSWDKVTSPGYGGPYYWDTSTNSWLKNAASVDVAEAYARWDFINNQAWFGGDYVGALSSTPGWSFTRASTGYAQTSAGVLVPFASGELRRTDKGVLIEGARTNLCLQSQQLDQGSGAPWNHTGVTVTADAISAPDGTTTADKIVEVNAASTPRIANGSLTISAATAHTFSIYAKAAERDQVRIVQEGSASFSAYFLLTGAGTISGLGGSCTATITALANGWYRCTLTWTTVGTNPQSYVATASGGSTIASGDNTKGLYLWGAQLELGAFPSSYIPTTTASATRAADSLSITGVTGLDYPLSLFAEFERAVDTGTQETQVYVYSTDSTERALIHRSSGGFLSVLVTDGGVTQASLSAATTPAVGAVARVAGRVALNDVNVAGGGVLATADTSCTMPAPVTTIRFGSTDAGAFYSFGYLRRAALFTRALTDSELQSVTT